MQQFITPFKKELPALKPVTSEELVSKVDKETLFLLGLIPYVIAEIAWDYADSCVNIAAIHKFKEHKASCRQIRALKTSYERNHSRHSVENMRSVELDNMLKFQEDYADFFEKLHSEIKREISQVSQSKSKDLVMLEVCAYSCIVAVSATRKYTETIEAKVEKMLGRPLGGTLVTKEIVELSKVCKTILGISKLPAFIDTFSSALSEYLLQTEIIENQQTA